MSQDFDVTSILRSEDSTARINCRYSAEAMFRSMVIEEPKNNDYRGMARAAIEASASFEAEWQIASLHTEVKKTDAASVEAQK